MLDKTNNLQYYTEALVRECRRYQANLLKGEVGYNLAMDNLLRIRMLLDYVKQATKEIECSL